MVLRPFGLARRALSRLPSTVSAALISSSPLVLVITRFNTRTKKPRRLARAGTKDRIPRYYPRYSSNPSSEDYEEFGRVKMMLHHPFRTIGELLILDNIAEDEVVAATFREAYQLCREYHYHANHDIDGYGVSIDAGNDEFEDNPEHGEPEENRGWEDLAVRRAEVREEDPDAIGKRDIDIMYDYTPHVGRYPDLDVGREYWVSLKSLNSAGDLQVPDQSLFARSLLAPQQRKVYDIVIDHYQQFLDGQMPRQFLIHVDGRGGTGKSYTGCLELLSMDATISLTTNEPLRSEYSIRCYIPT